MKTPLLNEIIKFSENKAEKRKIDKQTFIWAIICYVDFVNKSGYELVYVGRKDDKRRRNMESSIRKESTQNDKEGSIEGPEFKDSTF